MKRHFYTHKCDDGGGTIIIIIIIVETGENNYISTTATMRHTTGVYGYIITLARPLRNSTTDTRSFFFSVCFFVENSYIFRFRK